MDHIRRGSLELDELQALVLDEGDEMLRMGFIDDVEWILQQTPDQHQTALFSATMPTQIRNIAQKYLSNPVEVHIKLKTTTAATITQRYWQVSGFDKMDTLTRVLESEEFEGVIIFVRTKNATLEVAEKLQARGFAAEALNGDIAQNQREKTVNQLKKGNASFMCGVTFIGFLFTSLKFFFRLKTKKHHTFFFRIVIENVFKIFWRQFSQD